MSSQVPAKRKTPDPILAEARVWIVEGQDSGAGVPPCFPDAPFGACEIIARGVADSEPAACKEASEAARKARLIA
jgi:hypothetical protein